MKLIVPAYFYPDPLGSDWDTLLASPDGIGAIIVDDRNGALTGQAVDPNYTTAIANARAAGIGLLYYVDTGYATRPLAEVKADMDAWVALYGPPTGWFFDQASSAAADVDYYVDLYGYAAGRWVWLNWGTTPDEWFFHPEAFGPHPAFDAGVVKEDFVSALATWSPPWWVATSTTFYNRLGVIIHDAADGTAFSTAWSTITAQEGVGWAFVGTSSTYAALPSYWSTELGEVNTGILTGLSAGEWLWDVSDGPGVFVLSGGGYLNANPLAATGTFTLSGGGYPDINGFQPSGGEGSGTVALSLVETTLTVSPGSITAVVANGTPDATVTFTVTGSTAPTTTVVLDDLGGATGISIPVAVATSGSYTLSADDGTSTATASFTVSFIESTGGFPVPTYTPPAPVQNTIGVKKWVFQDPAGSDVYHFPFNPDAMTSPFGPKNISYAATTAIDGQVLMFEGQQAPVQWQFSGFIRQQSEYDAFVYWAAKRNRIWLTDHFTRAWLCYLTNFQPVPRRSIGVPWSHTYTMSALIVYGPVTPTSGP